MLADQVMMNVCLNEDVKRRKRLTHMQKSRSVVFKEYSEGNFSAPQFLLCTVSKILSFRNISLLRNPHLTVHLKYVFSW